MTASNQSALQQKEIWSIGGGKGGIGKSLIACNIAIILSRLNKKVLLVDADLGGANVHTTLGLETPEVTLSDFIKRRTENLNEVITDTGISNLQIISGARDFLDAANPVHGQKDRLLRHLGKIEADYIILDLGAGTSFNVLDFFLFSDHGLLVVLPEPTSIENVYRFIKSAFYRKFRATVENHALKEVVEAAKDQKNTLGLKTPHDLLQCIKGMEPEAGRRLEAEIKTFKPKLIINQVRSREDIRLGFSMRSAAKLYFGIDLEYPGYIEYDDCVWQSIRRRRPLALEHPDSRPHRSLEHIVQNLLLCRQLESPFA
ncbi:AAA family ATPase [Desulfurivibrio alkaliphilus]|uniref:ATP-binding protein n=1 Tax=Desulfurivibrio alkaliphilus (strain DSM 19089 / UNIQEM U267 / AHT2) TaxID=589865 RepID=D6Z028_DESAT|nr:AAA family ATPase [Desulfurivibrio alkaliphilus]ADH87061.1 ATP-binding protein [Desulfurivibrio alkaliphilus AHT 2]